MRLADWECDANQRQRRRWLWSTFAVGMCIASSVLASRLWQQPAPPPGPLAAAMVVTLAPQLQAAPEPQIVAENKPPVEAPAPEPEPKPKPEPEPTPVPKPEPEPKPSLQSEAELPPAPIPVPKAKPEPQPEPKPEPKSKPKPEPDPPPQPEPQPEPKPEPSPEPETAPAPRPAQTAPVTAATSTQQQSRDTGTGSVADTPPSYRQKLRAWLAQHKTYPRRARRLRQEGTAVLYFVIDRSGRVLDWEIRQSSGHTLLDEAVKDLIRSANPMPALPDDVSMQRLALTVPIRFRLQ